MGEATPTTPASSGDNPSGAGYKPGVGRPTSPRPTDAELEILHILWDGRECTVRDIRKALARNVDSWTTGANFGSNDVYAGPTA